MKPFLDALAYRDWLQSLAGMLWHTLGSPSAFGVAKPRGYNKFKLGHMSFFGVLVGRRYALNLYRSTHGVANTVASATPSSCGC